MQNLRICLAEFSRLGERLQSLVGGAIVLLIQFPRDVPKSGIAFFLAEVHLP
jgi:hypothetical protein